MNCGIQCRGSTLAEVNDYRLEGQWLGPGKPCRYDVEAQISAPAKRPTALDIRFPYKQKSL